MVLRPRWAYHALALIATAALGYLAWRGYQQPELILELGGLRLC